MSPRTLDEIKAHADKLAAQYGREVKQRGYSEGMARRYTVALERYIGNMGAYDYETFWAIRKVQAALLALTSGTTEAKA